MLAFFCFYIHFSDNFCRPAIDEGFYFLHQHRKFNGTSMRSEITMPAEDIAESTSSKRSVSTVSE